MEEGESKEMKMKRLMRSLKRIMIMNLKMKNYLMKRRLTKDLLFILNIIQGMIVDNSQMHNANFKQQGRDMPSLSNALCQSMRLQNSLCKHSTAEGMSLSNGP